EVAVRTHRDPGGLTGGRGDRVLGDDPLGGDLADLVAVLLGEPEGVIVRASYDAHRACTGAEGELGNHPGRGDPPDGVAVLLGEPEVVVRADGDALGAGGSVREPVVGEGPPARRVHAGDGVAPVAADLGNPQVA